MHEHDGLGHTRQGRDVPAKLHRLARLGDERAVRVCGLYTLACSNWTTTNIALTLPASKGATNLPAEPIAGRYNLTVVFQDQTSLDASFPNGSFVFNLQSASGVTAVPHSSPGTLAFFRLRPM